MSCYFFYKKTSIKKSLKITTKEYREYLSKNIPISSDMASNTLHARSKKQYVSGS